jgi:hypothetical protein
MTPSVCSQDQQFRRDGGVAPGVRECIEGYTAIIEVADFLPVLVVTKLDVLNDAVELGISVSGRSQMIRIREWPAAMDVPSGLPWWRGWRAKYW